MTFEQWEWWESLAGKLNRVGENMEFAANAVNAKTSEPVCGDPWSLVDRWWIDGIPKGQPRGRAFATGGKPRIFTPGTAEAWKGQIALAGQNRPHSPISGPVKLEIDCYFPRPKRLMRRKDPEGRVWHDARPDIDNVYKAIADALETLRIFDDDKRVCEVRMRTFYHAKMGRPGADLAIYVPGTTED